VLSAQIAVRVQARAKRDEIVGERDLLPAE
jgi:hypothetical protein